MSSSSNFHSSHGDTYDRMASNATLNIIKQVLPSMLPTPITPSSYILDNACGTGIVTQLIKSQFPFARIKGTDLAPGVVDIFKSRAEEKGWENVESEILDVRDLKTLSDGFFSHVVTNFGVCNSAEDPEGPGKAVREIYRVLKKGGTAVTTTWSELNFTTPMNKAARAIRPHEEPFTWKTDPEWERGSWLFKQFEDAGFGNKTSVRPVQGRMEAASVEELAGNMMLFKGMFYKGYSDEELKRVEEVLTDELRKLDAFEETEHDVGVKMFAWVAIAEK